MYQLIEAASENIAAQLCADRIADSLRQRLALQNAVSLFVSGGTSPAAVFARLAVTDLPWQRVRIFLVDERWAPDQPADQNQTLVQQHLLQHKARVAQFQPLILCQAFEDNLLQCNRLVAGDLRPDLVMLGMGLDGHTASLFPDAPDYDDAMNTTARYVAVHPASAPYPRISMSFSWLVSAVSALLYIPGPQKRAAFNHYLQTQQGNSPVRDLLARMSRQATVITTGETFQ